MKLFRNTCDLWFCFRKQWKCVLLDYGGVKRIGVCYCERHARIADEMFKSGEIKTKVPIEDYQGL